MHYRKRRGSKAIFCRYLLFLWVLLLMFGLPPPVQAQEIPDLPQPSDQDGDDSSGQNTLYFSESSLTFTDGRSVTIYRIGGPAHPLPQAGVAWKASTRPLSQAESVLANFPSYSWVFGCSPVAAAMIAAYYDRGAYVNIYTGPTAGSEMPVTDSSWPAWVDETDSYVSNPLVASQNGIDGRQTKGSIDDYWVAYGSSLIDPYLTRGWPQHSWGDALGDYMKTSQSAFGNADGSTLFSSWSASPDPPLNCDTMAAYNLYDGTLGQKLFYEARGYTVSECYNQKTDNNGGGFTLADFQAEIDSGNPVILNLAGHSIVGYGYDGATIYVRDTWSSNPDFTPTFTWGTHYDGMNLLAVSVIRLSPVSEAPTYRVLLPWVDKQGN